MTNYERIKNMSREEMAETLQELVVNCGTNCIFSNKYRCRNCIFAWLSQEVEE